MTTEVQLISTRHVYPLLHRISTWLQIVSPHTQCSSWMTYSDTACALRILASNRDEYFDRQALPAHWHIFEDPNAFSASSNENVEELDKPEPWVLSGRDIGNPVGGTWLGMTRDLRIGIM